MWRQVSFTSNVGGHRTRYTSSQFEANANFQTLLQAFLQVYFERSSESSFRDTVDSSTLIAGAPHWGCPASSTSTKSAVILRRVLEVVSSTKESTVFTTAAATYTDFFSKSKIRFKTNKYPQGFFHEHRHATHLAPEPQGSAGRRLQGSVVKAAEHFLSKTWNAIKKIAHEVEVVAEDTVKLAEDIAKGEYHASTVLSSDSWSYNFDSSKTYNRADKHFSIDATVNCTNCYAAMDFAIIFELDIADYVSAKLTYSLTD